MNDNHGQDNSLGHDNGRVLEMSNQIYYLTPTRCWTADELRAMPISQVLEPTDDLVLLETHDLVEVQLDTPIELPIDWNHW